MSNAKHIDYHRTKDGVRIRGDADKILPLIKSDQNQQWFKIITTTAITCLGKWTGIAALINLIKRENGNE